MKKTTRGILQATAAAAAFGAYFALSLSCATPKKAVEQSDERASVYTPETESLTSGYDFTLLSGPNSAAKIYKLVSKDDGSVHYALSRPNRIKSTSSKKPDYFDTDVHVTADELSEMVVIEEDDAKAAVEFIAEVEEAFEERRENDGTLSDFRIVKYKEETIWVEKSRTETQYGTTSEKEEKTVRYPVELLGIQLKTVADIDKKTKANADRDMIVLVIGGTSVTVTPDELKQFGAELAK